MEIHKPKPWHGVREFLKEYGIIVLGVLTALGAERLVEAFRWHEYVENARNALRPEIAGNLGYVEYRRDVAPCITKRLILIDNLIEQAAVSGRTAGISGVENSVGHAVGTGTWNAEVAAQTLVHFPLAERGQLAAFHDTMQSMMTWRDREGAAWDGLAVLDGPPKPIGALDIAQLRINLRVAHAVEKLWENNARVQIERAHALGAKSPPPTSEWIAKACPEIKVGVSG